jgi:DNA-directed RNA polymerase subunit K/omega
MAPAAVPAVAGPSTSPVEGPLSGFHLVSVVFQRAKQLQAGARPRVEAGHHKSTRVALLEVLADTVSWTAV